MTEGTDEDDEGRPLTPEERKALRRLIKHETAMIEAGELVAHSTWFGKLVFRVITFSTAIIAFVGAIITVKSWAGFR